MLLLSGCGQALFGKANRAVPPLLQQLLGGKHLQHFVHRRPGHIQHVRNLGGAGFSVAASQLINRKQISNLRTGQLHENPPIERGADGFVRAPLPIRILPSVAAAGAGAARAAAAAGAAVVFAVQRHLAHGKGQNRQHHGAHNERGKIGLHKTQHVNTRSFCT
ncbi:hypothetical protein SDC9_190137 [bioreactor metagenome]|uniref:Uncharacterized protein n=1 Tax=bioreactor metagenome TaxID=1076179 RepID=A0A645HUP8_9ZZZZ